VKTILVDGLVKNFEIIQKEKGLVGSFKSLIKPNKKIVKALRSISFSVESGELVGFIGPNGAGKTTTLKVLSGLLYPSSGKVNVLGFDPWERNPKYLKSIALVMGQKNQLWWDLPAVDTLELNAAIYEIPKDKFNKSLDKLTNLLSVKKLLKTQVRRLSLGQRMRLELVAALLHEPKVLFLDEPTIGLDVVAQQKMRDFVAEYNKKFKSTILLTSHNMDDVINLARRVIVIDEGKIYFDGSLNDLVKRFAKVKTINVHFTKEVNESSLKKIGKVKSVNFSNVILVVPRKRAAYAASELLQNYPVGDLTIEEEPVDEIIREVFKGGLK